MSHGAALARRVLAAPALALAATLVVFLAVEALPGDVAQYMLGVGARPDTLAALRADLGLDRPAIVRYLDWVWGLLRGDLGLSLTYRRPAAELIGERLLVTVPLAALAATGSLAVGLPLGFLAAARRDRAADWAVAGFVQAGLAVPAFWLGILLILLFAVEFGWLPAGGFPGWDAGAGPALAALLLPAAALALPEAAILARLARGAMIETLREDFMRTAYAKGLSRRQALLRHGVRHAMLPILAVVGLQFAFLVGGAVLVENVFALPGLGQLVTQSVGQRDLVTLRSAVVALVALVAAVNLLADLALAALDPRPEAGR